MTDPKNPPGANKIICNMRSTCTNCTQEIFSSANFPFPVDYPAVVLSSNKRQLVQYDPCLFTTDDTNTLWFEFDILTLRKQKTSIY